MYQIILLLLLTGYKIIKAFTDFIFALVIASALSPLFLILVLLHLVGLKVLFFQKRIGYNNKPFTIYKIRSIYPERYPLLNKIGIFLRKSSFDEWPQVFNILKGDMSFIGPRPLFPEYLDKYTAFQQKRHRVKPGITGLAQVKGLNDISWTHRFRYDVFYTEHVSFALDAYITGKTLKILLGFQRFQENRKHIQEPFA